MKLSFLEEENNKRSTIALDDVIYGPWDSGLASDARWVGDDLVWTDSCRNVKKISYPSMDAVTIIPREKMVIVNDIPLMVIRYNNQE